MCLLGQSNFHQIFCMLLMAVAGSFADGNAIRYVLPVTWMKRRAHGEKKIGHAVPNTTGTLLGNKFL